MPLFVGSKCRDFDKIGGRLILNNVCDLPCNAYQSQKMTFICLAYFGGLNWSMADQR